MQDLLLYSQIPANRHKQVLQILAGVTAAQPTQRRTQVLIFEQLKLPTASKKTQPNNAQRRTYQHLVRDDGLSSSWRRRTADVPEPGVTQIISQSATDIAVSGLDLEAFRPGSETYRLVSQYCLVGSQFVHGNVVVSICRILRAPGLTDDPTEGSFPDLDSLSPLDPSGSYIVEAFVRVEDGSTTALRDRATKDLLSFAHSLKGAVDLRVPDRLALDPKVKIP